MELRRIKHNTPEYERIVALRRRVLRAPLGLDFTPEQLAAEADDIHLAGFEGETPLACMILSPVSAQEFKMRQVAVAPERQGEGLGSRLVEYCETVARAAGCAQITLHARETAVPFYLRAGYEIVGEPFEEVTVPHRKMSKWLK
jgi:predicted GNAT family N-acyltransferase